MPSHPHKKPKLKFGDASDEMNAIGRGKKDIDRNMLAKQSMGVASKSNLPKKPASKPTKRLASIRRGR